jgi:hypothetical protein
MFESCRAGHPDEFTCGARTNLHAGGLAAGGWLEQNEGNSESTKFPLAFAIAFA